MIAIRIWLLGICFILAAGLAGQSPDLDWVLKNYPDRVQALFQQLDGNQPALMPAIQLAQAGNMHGACVELLHYYRQNTSFPQFRDSLSALYDLPEALRLLRDTFYFQSIRARQPRRPDGGLDWTHRGPTDDEEWAHLLNRHEWMQVILDAYRHSGKEELARHLNDLLLDWIISNPFPVEDECCPQWRTLNAAIRFSSWPALFYGLQKSPSFSDAARLLMLISVGEQASLIHRFHWTHQNHALFQLNALARIGVYWPEFKRAKAYFDYAAQHMLYEMEGQVLPDGVQDELTSTYHYHALRLFQGVMDLAASTDRELPAAYRAGLEKMYNYLAYTMRPDGHNVLNNDSDLSNFRPEIAQAAKLFRRPDWEYIISNGRRGEKPEQLSLLFPYAGQAIMRSGWDSLAHWSYFDGGPYGTAHRHDDKLHLSISAFGRDLLVDGGRYWYNPDIWREYFVSSYSHNVILVDGFGHKPDVNRYTHPDEVAFETNDRFTYTQAEFTAGFRQVEDSVRHRRGIFYLKNQFWIVIDQLESGKPHTIQPLWHFHPTCTVSQDGNQVYSTDPGQGNLLIQPLGEGLTEVELRHGPETLADPERYRQWKPRSFDEFPIQGAYSKGYNDKQASTVAIYSDNLDQQHLQAWLLIPFFGQDRPEITKSKVKQKKGKTILHFRMQGRHFQLILDLEKRRIINFLFD